VRPGDTIEDYCRACRIDRRHTVMACDPAGHPLRVVCDYCRSEHNFRGGPRMEGSSGAIHRASSVRPGVEVQPAPPADGPFALVSERERTVSAVSSESTSADLELLLRRVIREESGLTPVTPAEKWRGGLLVLRPGSPGLQEKSWPIETFFHKVVMLRNRLRTLEQQLNASDLPEDVKIRLQGYITGCYGSLTSFNVLFAEEDDQFKGSGD
jgi:hypothetical protein